MQSHEPGKEQHVYIIKSLLEGDLSTFKSELEKGVSIDTQIPIDEIFKLTYDPYGDHARMCKEHKVSTFDLLSSAVSLYLHGKSENVKDNRLSIIKEIVRRVDKDFLKNHQCSVYYEGDGDSLYFDSPIIVAAVSKDIELINALAPLKIVRDDKNCEKSPFHLLLAYTAFKKSEIQHVLFKNLEIDGFKHPEDKKTITDLFLLMLQDMGALTGIYINPHETFNKIIKQCQVYLTYGVLDLEKVRAAIQDNSIALRVLDGNVNRLNAKDRYFGVELSKGDIINRNLIIILHEAEQLQSKQTSNHPHPLYLSAKSIFACKIDTTELENLPDDENADLPTPRREK